MIKTVIIDDETRARDTTRTILELSGETIAVVGEAGTVGDAYELICREKPGLVLLDIDLPDGTAFDLLRRFAKIFFNLIFITAHQEYAITAFKFSAVDYILKPVHAGDLLHAVARAADNLREEEAGLRMQALLSNVESLKKLVLRTAESIHIVNVKEIIRCEADVNYTRFYLAEGMQLLVSRTLKEYAGLLEGNGFFRPHQSHLVNIAHIRRFDKADGGTLVLDDASEVPVASRKRESLLALFDSL